jgi:hypothetical protein
VLVYVKAINRTSKLKGLVLNLLALVLTPLTATRFAKATVFALSSFVAFAKRVAY